VLNLTVVFGIHRSRFPCGE